MASDARVDIPGLRFARFEVSALEVSAGDADELRAELLLVRDGAPAVPVVVHTDRVTVEDCAVERVGGAALRLTRRGAQLKLEAGGASKTCEVSGLGERVGIAVRLGEGNIVRALKIRRLD